MSLRGLKREATFKVQFNKIEFWYTFIYVVEIGQCSRYLRTTAQFKVPLSAVGKNFINKNFERTFLLDDLSNCPFQLTACHIQVSSPVYLRGTPMKIILRGK